MKTRIGFVSNSSSSSFLLLLSYKITSKEQIRKWFSGYNIQTFIERFKKDFFYRNYRRRFIYLSFEKQLI